MPKNAPAEIIEASDMPRSRSGLNVYYEYALAHDARFTVRDPLCSSRRRPCAACACLSHSSPRWQERGGWVLGGGPRLCAAAQWR